MIVNNKKNKRSPEGQIIDSLENVVERQRETIREKDDRINKMKKLHELQLKREQRKNIEIAELKTQINVLAEDDEDAYIPKPGWNNSDNIRIFKEEE